MKRYKHRLMAPDDQFVVGAIDLMCFGRFRSWDQPELEGELSKPGTTAIVALRPGTIVQSSAVAGFMVYRVHVKSKKSATMEIVRIAVDEDYQRQGVGRFLVNKVARHLRPSRSELIVEVPDAFLPGAHLFFKACGFKAEKVLRRHDGYQDFTRFLMPLQMEAVA